MGYGRDRTSIENHLQSNHNIRPGEVIRAQLPVEPDITTQMIFKRPIRYTEVIAPTLQKQASEVPDAESAFLIMALADHAEQVAYTAFARSTSITLITSSILSSVAS